MLMDLLWSDPTTNDGVQGVQPSPRGPGLVTFGPDRVKDFCKVRGRHGRMRHIPCQQQLRAEGVCGRSNVHVPCGEWWCKKENTSRTPTQTQHLLHRPPPPLVLPCACRPTTCR